MTTNLDKKPRITKKHVGIGAIAITLAHALVLGGSGLFLASCANNASEKSAHTSSQKVENGKIAVSASFYPVAWLAEQIGGDAVEVTSATPANAEPHDFELAPKDVAELSDSNLLLYVEGFQPSLDEAVATISGPTVVNLADAVDLAEADAATAAHEHEHGHDHGHDHADEAEHEHEHADEAEHADHDHAEHADHEDADHDHDHADEADHDHADEAEHAHEHDHGNLDPHFWLDPSRMNRAAESITHALSDIAPDHEEEFTTNYAQLTQKMDDLLLSYEQGLSQCTLKTFVTSHAAFGYIARNFNLTQASISGIDPESEPSPADLAEVKKVIQESGTTTIFTEELVSPKTAEALAAETGATVDVLSPIESQPENGDYISAMTSNLDALKAALQCQ